AFTWAGGSCPPASTVAGLPVRCTRMKLAVTAPNKTSTPWPSRPATYRATPRHRDRAAAMSAGASAFSASSSTGGAGPWIPASMALTLSAHVGAPKDGLVRVLGHLVAVHRAAERVGVHRVVERQVRQLLHEQVLRVAQGLQPLRPVGRGVARVDQALQLGALVLGVVDHVERVEVER